MRCLRCRERHEDEKAARCPACGAELAFKPSRDGIHDAAFAAVLETVSGGGELRFCERQLYYELCWRLRDGSSVAVAPARWRRLYARWCAVYGEPRGLVAPAKRRRDTTWDAELATYSFDRAVVTDRRDIAEVLLANHFHFENNCAVLTVDGYPEASFDLVRRMLRNNPRLVVLAVHDATPSGAKLPALLAQDKRWFKDYGTVIDGGLGADHAAVLEGVWLPAARGASGAPRGKRFLDRYRLEVPAFRPGLLLRRVFRAIHRHAEAEPLTRAERARGYRSDPSVFGFSSSVSRRLGLSALDLGGAGHLFEEARGEEVDA